MNKDLEARKSQVNVFLLDAAKVDAIVLSRFVNKSTKKNKRLAFKEEVNSKLKDAQELSLGNLKFLKAIFRANSYR